MSFKYVDIFAGIGGFHAALSGLGGECVYAVEKDEYAAKIYEQNWGINPLGDVTAQGWLDKVTSEDVDVLVGGFPCQSYSKSGAQRGIEDARGTLFFNLCEAIERWKPSVVMLENVRNLTGPKHKDTWNTIINSLRDLGYRVSSTPVILSPSQIERECGGRPHNRERVFILGTYVGKEVAYANVTCSPTVDVSKLSSQSWNLKIDLPMNSEDESLTLSEQELTWVNAWREFREVLFPNESLPSVVWVDSFFSNEVPEGTPNWKVTILKKNREFYLKSPEIINEWYLKWNVASFPNSRKKFEWQAGNSTWNTCLAQFRPSGLRVKRGNTIGSLVAITQTPITLETNRRLSVRECARLQGLPEWFSFAGQADRHSYKQLGNGVCVGAVYYALREHILNTETQKTLAGTEILQAVLDSPRSPDEFLQDYKSSS